MRDDNRSSADYDRQLELLAGQVLGDLSQDELTDLEGLNNLNDLQQELWELETTAAAVELALNSSRGENLQPMPDELRSRIISSAQQQPATPAINRGNPTSATTIPDSVQRQAVGQPKVRAREIFAWAACAAALLLCLGLWQSGQIEPSAVALNPSELRQSLLNAEDAIRADWSPGKTPFETPVSGDITWSTTQQQGVMRFVGLPVNDPKLEQYQLWIIDPDRDAEPIDGGVFDVTSDGEVFITVDPKLQVIRPAAFAITVEKPGGVVVSTQEKLPLLAPVDQP